MGAAVGAGVTLLPEGGFVAFLVGRGVGLVDTTKRAIIKAYPVELLLYSLMYQSGLVEIPATLTTPPIAMIGENSIMRSARVVVVCICRRTQSGHRRLSWSRHLLKRRGRS